MWINVYYIDTYNKIWYNKLETRKKGVRFMDYAYTTTSTADALKISAPTLIFYIPYYTMI